MDRDRIKEIIQQELWAILQEPSTTYLLPSTLPVLERKFVLVDGSRWVQGIWTGDRNNWECPTCKEIYIVNLSLQKTDWSYIICPNCIRGLICSPHPANKIYARNCTNLLDSLPNAPVISCMGLPKKGWVVKNWREFRQPGVFQIFKQYQNYLSAPSMPRVDSFWFVDLVGTGRRPDHIRETNTEAESWLFSSESPVIRPHWSVAYRASFSLIVEAIFRHHLPLEWSVYFRNVSILLDSKDPEEALARLGVTREDRIYKELLKLNPFNSSPLVLWDVYVSSVLQEWPEALKLLKKKEYI